MTRRQWNISIDARQLLHVETPLGIVLISAGLHDRHGREVDSIQVLPNRYAGEKKVKLYSGSGGVRLVQMKGVVNR